MFKCLKDRKDGHWIYYLLLKMTSPSAWVPSPHGSGGDQVTLYRDRALAAQRISPKDCHFWRSTGGDILHGALQ